MPVAPRCPSARIGTDISCKPRSKSLTSPRPHCLGSAPVIGVTGDLHEAPSCCTRALGAPTSQGKPEGSPALRSVGDVTLSCPASLGRPPEPSTVALGNGLPPMLQQASGVLAIGDPLEVPSKNYGAHAAPLSTAALPTVAVTMSALATFSDITGGSPPMHFARQATFDPRDFEDSEFEECLPHCRPLSPARTAPGHGNGAQGTFLPDGMNAASGDAPRSAGASPLVKASHSRALVEHSVGQRAHRVCLVTILTAWRSCATRQCASAPCDPVDAPRTGSDTPWRDLFVSEAQAELPDSSRSRLLAIEAQYRQVKRHWYLRSLARLNVNEYRAKAAMLAAIRGWHIVAYVSDSKPKRSRGKRGKKHHGKR